MENKLKRVTFLQQKEAGPSERRVKSSTRSPPISFTFSSSSAAIASIFSSLQRSPTAHLTPSSVLSAGLHLLHHHQRAFAFFPSFPFPLQLNFNFFARSRISQCEDFWRWCETSLQGCSRFHLHFLLCCILFSFIYFPSSSSHYVRAKEK